MKALGLVREISGDTVEIEAYGSMEVCASCSTENCSSCSTSGRSRRYKAKNSRNLPLKTGNLVEIYMPAGKAAAAFARVIAMPLALFFSAFASAALFTPREGIKIAAGFTGFAAGITVNFIVSGKIKNREMPDITRIFR